MMTGSNAAGRSVAGAVRGLRAHAGTASRSSARRGGPPPSPDDVHEQALDLGQDLLVAEAGAGDRAGRAGRDAGAAALAQRRVDLGDHRGPRRS